MSPILYLFLNVDLIKSIINKNGVAIALIYDYIVWVTRPDIISNTYRFKMEVILKLEIWVESSATNFQSGVKSGCLFYTKLEKK